MTPPAPAPIRYPRPLRLGDTIAVTAPSAGVAEHHRPRLEFAVEWLRRRGYRVVLGECLDGAGTTSAPPADRAAELTAMLTDPGIAAVVPPWGGELAIEILPHLDLERIAAARPAPAWLVGYSDLSTVMLALTLATGVATLHGHNLMDTPYRLPSELTPWHEIASLPAGATVTQRPATRVRSAAAGFDRWEDGPEIAASTEYTLDEPTDEWVRLDHQTPEVVDDATARGTGDDGTPGALDVTGRLIGGCVEVVGPLAGTPYGDVAAFTPPEGRIVFLEVSGDPALSIARHLWSMRLAGWFDPAATRAVLIGRTHAPAEAGFTQHDAVVSALGDLGVPVVLDVDCGHVVPQLGLVAGARARVVVGGGDTRIEQTLV